MAHRRGEHGLGSWGMGLLLALAVGAGCDRSPESLGDRLPAVKERFERVCSRCHPLDLPLRRRKSLDGWRRTVAAMRRQGATLTDREAEEIATYLAQIRGR